MEMNGKGPVAANHLVLFASYLSIIVHLAGFD